MAVSWAGMPGKSTPKKPRVPNHASREATRFRRLLLRWFHKHGRDLPWRRTRDPYAVLVSEFMLQQTQVSRVLDYYHRFLETFPTVGTLASAQPGRVRERWDGLGYYRRAENLHQLAKRVMEHHDGQIPDDGEELLALPGIGRYTAGAVLSFAYERPTPAVDTNVSRVLRRAFHPRLGRGAGADRRVWATAAALLPARGKDAWSFNQAVMELGALICTARVARCEACPVRAACKTGRSTAQT